MLLLPAPPPPVDAHRLHEEKEPALRWLPGLTYGLACQHVRCGPNRQQLDSDSVTSSPRLIQYNQNPFPLMLDSYTFAPRYFTLYTLAM